MTSKDTMRGARGGKDLQLAFGGSGNGEIMRFLTVRR